MGMGNQDQQGGFDPFALQRPDCSYQLVLEHEEKASSTRDARARYFEYRSLIVAAVQFVEDGRLRSEVERALANPLNNLSMNIIRNYKAEIAAGTPYTVVWEAEYSRLVPIIEALWGKCKRALILQQFLVWTITDSAKQLHDLMIDRNIERLMTLRNEVAPMPEQKQVIRPAIGPQSVELLSDGGIEKEQPPVPVIPRRKARNEFEQCFDPEENFDFDVTGTGVANVEPKPIEELNEGTLAKMFANVPEVSDADMKEILSYADKTVREAVALSSEKPRERDSLPEQRSIIDLRRVISAEAEIDEADPIDMKPVRSARRRLIEPVKSYPDATGLPSDFVVPSDVDESENVMADWPSDKGVDFDKYVVSDEQLEEASRVMKRALRKKMAEKRELNVG